MKKLSPLYAVGGLIIVLLCICLPLCGLVGTALISRTVASANHFRSALPFSAQEVQTASVDLFPDWDYYLKAKLPEEDFPRYVQDLELQFCGDDPDFWVAWHGLDTPAWWDPTGDTSETYCLEEGDIWTLAKYESGHVYLRAFSH